MSPSPSPSPSHLGELSEVSRRLAREALALGQTRLELLAVELQEERERWLRAVLLGLGVATFGLLAGVALTVGLVAWLWPLSPIAAVLVPLGLNVTAAFGCGRGLQRLVRTWESFPATFAQLHQDREALEQWLH